MSNTYGLGTAVKVSVAFTDIDDAAFDPATVTCEVQAPGQDAGAKTTYTFGTDAALVKDSTGSYHLWIATDTVGPWVYGFVGIDSDGHEIANDATFDVETNFR
jgi:hypothetical protein